MTDLPRLSTLTDWELWACAKQKIDQHGETASEMAALRADELLVAGDVAGHRAWLDILARIHHLQSPQTGETAH